MNQQEKGCHSKKVYLSRIQALVVASKRMGSGAPPLRVYQCRFCHFWHLTKTPEGYEPPAHPAGAA